MKISIWSKLFSSYTSWPRRCCSLKLMWCSDHLKNILFSYWWQYMFSLQSPIRGIIGRGIFFKWLLHHISFNLLQCRGHLVCRPRCAFCRPCRALCQPHKSMTRNIWSTSSSKVFWHFLGWKNKFFQNCSKLPKNYFRTIKFFPKILAI